jgi:DNA-binding transcriptional LysR family regulator
LGFEFGCEGADFITDYFYVLLENRGIPYSIAMFQDLFSKRGISLERLHSFLEVATAGGISRAAPNDAVRQAQYSRQIKELEEFFGSPLTHRQGRKLALTVAGKRLARLIQEQFLGLQDFQSDCGQVVRVPLTIGSDDSLLQWLLIPRMGAIQRAAPRLVLAMMNLWTEKLVRKLADMTLDFALLRRNAVVPPLKSIPLGTLRYDLFVPRQLMAARASQEPQEILPHVPLAIQSSPGAFRRTLEKAVHAARANLDVRVQCDTFPEAMRALQTGEYATILPRLAAGELDKERFVQVPVPWFKKLERPVALAWNPRLPKVRASAEKLIPILATILKFDS